MCATCAPASPANSSTSWSSSPPFLAVRAYLPADHADKHKEIGGEPTPGQFLDTLFGLTAQWAGLLPEWASLAVELGDTMSGSGGAGGDYGTGEWRDGQPKFPGTALADRKNKVLNADGQRLQQVPAGRWRSRRSASRRRTTSD